MTFFYFTLFNNFLWKIIHFYSIILTRWLIMNYPNNIKKDNYKINYGNRGMGLENDLNDIKMHEMT